MSPVVGILGVGHLGEALARGLARAGGCELLLSARGAARSRRLAAELGARRAASNRELVAACQVVLVAIRPGQLAAAIAGLGWRAGQLLVSCAAGVDIGALRAAAGEPRVVRAMPILAAAAGLSPTPIHPADPDAERLLAALGPVIPLPDEAAFETACVSAACYGWLHAQIGALAGWAEARGMPAPEARSLFARTFAAAGAMIAADPGRPPEEALRALATPGGITEQGLAVLAGHDALAAWEAACEQVRERLLARRAGPAPGPGPGDRAKS